MAAFLHLSLLRNRPLLSECFHGPDCSNIFFYRLLGFHSCFRSNHASFESRHFAFVQLLYRKNLWNYGGKFHHCFRLKGKYFIFICILTGGQILGQNNCSARKYQLSCLDAVPAIHQSLAAAPSGPFVKVYFTFESAFIFSLVFDNIVTLEDQRKFSPFTPEQFLCIKSLHCSRITSFKFTKMSFEI